MLLTMNSNIQISLFPALGYSQSDRSRIPFQPTIVPPLPPSDTHYWRVNPAVGVMPRLPWQRVVAIQSVLYKRDTDQPVGMVQRVQNDRGPFRTAWFSGDQIETKRHWSVQSGRKFLERKFTRTSFGIPSPAESKPGSEHCRAEKKSKRAGDQRRKPNL